MRRSKELIALLVLLAAAMAFVLWYVIDRRARPPAPARPAAAPGLGPTAPATTKAAPVAIQDRKTIDFSGGTPVVKDDDANKAAIDAAVKDMEAALKEVSFDPPKKPAEPAPEKKP